MPRIKIKQLDERVATSGVHFGGLPERRKLFPGEVVEIPEDLLLADGTSLLHAVLATGRIELTLDPATRPLDFADVIEAKLTAPTYRSRGPDEDIEIERAKAAVAARLAQQAAEAAKPKQTKPKADAEPEDKKPRESSSPDTALNRRAERRRAATQAIDRGEKIST